MAGLEWQEVAVRTTEELTDAVENIFYDLGAGGVVIEDPRVLAEYIESGTWDYHSIPAELLEREFIIVKAYFPVNEEWLVKEEELQIRLAQLGNLFPCTLLATSFTKLAEEDWAHAWKAYYKPHHIGKIVIKPTWENYDLQEGEVVVELDPGMAFGTGTHPTTTMVIELLQAYLQAGDVVVDVGTGTGVLAVAAAKLGAAKVTALDIDPVSVDVAKENIVLNNVQDRVEVRRNDLLAGFSQKAQVVTANIIADVIIRLLPDAENIILPGGYLLASGIISGREADVVEKALENKFTVAGRLESGEWTAICFKRD